MMDPNDAIIAELWTQTCGQPLLPYAAVCQALSIEPGWDPALEQAADCLTAAIERGDLREVFQVTEAIEDLLNIRLAVARQAYLS